MNRTRILISTLGCCALLAATGFAQHQTYDKATPPAQPTHPDEEISKSPDAQNKSQGEVGSTDRTNVDRVSTATEDKVTATDQLTTASTRFKTMDTDGDNRISRAEFTLAPNIQLQTGSEATAPSADQKKDPETSAPEGRSATSSVGSATSSTGANNDSISNGVGPGSNSYERFNRLDTDKDGFLSQAELAAESQTPSVGK